MKIINIINNIQQSVRKIPLKIRPTARKNYLIISPFLCILYQTPSAHYKQINKIKAYIFLLDKNNI